MNQNLDWLVHMHIPVFQNITVFRLQTDMDKNIGRMMKVSRREDMWIRCVAQWVHACITYS